MKDTFRRMVGVDAPVEIAAPINQAQRVAAVAADALDELSDQCGGRADLKTWAAALRAEFSTEPPSLGPGYSNIVRIECVEKLPR